MTCMLWKLHWSVGNFSLELLGGDNIAGGMEMDARQREQPVHPDASCIIINYSLLMARAL